ncbi:ArsR/SmtB family transcription factor [Cohaesibacter gelatinilyticus]|uniref:Transcriptional regulator, ArsR family n=1 Tax=Cohaesibacter gelatinilyticus TaxID=372072 RepID=A0A285NI28_9HYPH|nr:metalloregulator ArsR/SmtB family transcription factor [Cohaesibacter gelatinilyticus]SNZ09140.1 transcriptional regulator, ArsR family [Cohaesibacter gelatinilyticus]
MATLDEIVGILKAAGEQTRLRLLALLQRGDLSVKDLTAILNQSQPRISRHLKLLFETDLVERVPEGAWVYYRLSQDRVLRGLISHLLSELDENDVQMARDREKLEAVKSANAQAAQEYFQTNAGRWDEIRALHVPESAVETEILDLIGKDGFSSLLDLGTGTGSILALLAGHCQHGLGLDSNPPMLSVARARLDAPQFQHLHVQQGDILDLATHETRYDLVSLHQVLHYLDDPLAAISETGHVMAVKGRLLIVDFAPHEHEFLRKDHAHRRLGFSHEIMEGWLGEAGFDLLSVRDLEAEQGELAKERVPLTVSLWLAQRR